ncbi:MAG: YbaB/EbfC family nucleoid-associated protein, partial [Planctomycetes bacterium]|nr:YbaB/EbfC family nucleoid-associated protein [Planctomycetota bacterium]
MQPGNFGELIRNVTRMRKDMDRVQEGLRSRYVEGRAGGDLVEATLNGRQELVKLTLNEKVLQPGQDG